MKLEYVCVGALWLVLAQAGPTRAQEPLTAQQKERYLVRHHELSFEGQGWEGDTDQDQIIISSDPTESTVQPQMHSMHSVAQSKSLRGIPDEPFANGSLSDSAIEYPAALAQGAEPDAAFLRNATRAFLMGNSVNMKSSEAVINDRLYPRQVAAFSAQNITISANNPLVIQGPDPVVLNSGTITFEPGAELIINTDAHITAQTLHAEGKATIRVVGSAGPNGKAGPLGRMGTDGSTGVKGEDGGTGGAGEPGGPGKDGADLIFQIGVISGGGTVTIQAGGGNGGTGGAGGVGGAGGSMGGAGGKGGTGGHGGDGGNGGIVQVFYESIGSANLTADLGFGTVGNGGAAGEPGKAENGKNLGPGTPGLPGDEKGQPAVVTFAQNSQ